MRTVVNAQMEDLESMVAIDHQVIGNDSRRGEIEKAIREKQCLVVKDGKTMGFLLYYTHFFGNTFISLVIISPGERRKGYASSLMSHLEKISPTTKIFSSTNESNMEMHRVFQKNGYIRSGVIDNMDPGDPRSEEHTSELQSHS